jgi:hypothetical protein
MAFVRNEGPKIFLSITILVMILNYYFEPVIFQRMGSYVKESVVIIASLMLGLGFANAMLRDIPRITRREDGWYLSAITVFFIVIMFILSLGNKYWPNSFSGSYSFLYQEVYRSFGNTIGSFAAFFVFSAIYRAMRLKSFEASAYTLAHILVVLGNAPIGAVIIPSIALISDWINNVIVSSGMRGFIITSSLGGVIIVFRYLIGKSETVLGGST